MKFPNKIPILIHVLFRGVRILELIKPNKRKVMEEEKSILENLIEICIKEQKEILDEDGETYTEEDVRLTVYENLHDNLKYYMSDVAYS